MNTLPDLIPGRWSLVILPGRANRLLLELTARLAQRLPVCVLDGGNCFNAYTVARALGRLTPDVTQALKRIHVARAFTCYQVLALLEDTPPGEAPILVLDLLATFYDQSVSLPERQRLLSKSLDELQRLSRLAPLGVSARLPKAGQPEAELLLQSLEQAAGQVWRMEPDIPASPPQLF